MSAMEWIMVESKRAELIRKQTKVAGINVRKKEKVSWGRSHNVKDRETDGQLNDKMGTKRWETWQMVIYVQIRVNWKSLERPSFCNGHKSG